MKYPFCNSILHKIGLFIAICQIPLCAPVTSLDSNDDGFSFALDPIHKPDFDLWGEDRESKNLRDSTLLFSIDYEEALAPIEDGFQIEPPMSANLKLASSDELEPIFEDAAEPEIAQAPEAAPAAPAATLEPAAPQAAPTDKQRPAETNKIKINFNNVSIIEYLHFISRISGKNFIFDENDLQFNVTIVSEEPTSIENVMAALIQELRIHDLTLIEQGNDLIIHKNLKVNSISRVVAEDLPGSSEGNAEIVTRVFRLNTLDPVKAAGVIRPLISDRALIEPLRETNHLIVTDVVSNVNQISELLKSIDAPNSGLVIGQYVARTTDIETLVPIVQKIMLPISQDQPLTFVPYTASNSLFIVSTPFLVERSISILQHLDQEKGKTRIIELRELRFEQQKAPPPKPVAPGAGELAPEVTRPPQFLFPSEAEAGSAWNFGPSRADIEQDLVKELRAQEARAGTITPIFIPVPGPECAEKPEGLYNLPPPPLELGSTEIEEEEGVERLSLPSSGAEFYTPVPVNRQKFYIYSLQYRTGDVVLGQLQQIAISLQNTTSNIELLAAINTIQWLQAAKALVITATPEIIDKIRNMLEQLDIPLRQVFIEMLILQTTLDDSLHYGVDWGSRFGGGNQAGSVGFQEGPSTLQGTLDSTGVTDLGGIRPNPGLGVPNPFNNALIPNPNNLAKNTGFSLGVIGQHIVHKGLGLTFNSIGALVTAVHDFATTNIVMSPKIVTEDGIPAQIFVGVNTPFKTQSVSNDLGSIITSNFEFRDVGTSLQVTPHITNGDIISLDILEEFSSLATTPATTGNSNEVIGPTTNKNSTRTSILVPDGFFVILSGMIQDEVDETRSQVPCLGSIPLVGGAFVDTRPVHNKRNLMIFIRPQIIDTDEELLNITRHQQDIWKQKNYIKPMWEVETETALDLFNVRATFNTDDKDDVPCREFVH